MRSSIRSVVPVFLFFLVLTFVFTVSVGTAPDASACVMTCNCVVSGTGCRGVRVGDICVLQKCDNPDTPACDPGLWCGGAGNP
jgi:hypothetical protein